jgi:hypothetical protein
MQQAAGCQLQQPWEVCRYIVRLEEKLENGDDVFAKFQK